MNYINATAAESKRFRRPGLPRKNRQSRHRVRVAFRAYAIALAWRSARIPTGREGARP